METYSDTGMHLTFYYELSKAKSVDDFTPPTFKSVIHTIMHHTPHPLHATIILKEADKRIHHFAHL